jgi:hypothetical protein
VTRRSSAVPLRRSIPLLLAVLALLGPAAARAGDPAPDPPGANVTPVPDPAPVAHPTGTTARTARLPTSIVSPAGRSVPAPSSAKRAPARAKHAVRHASVHRPLRSDLPLVDVPPLRVDVPRGLGATASSLGDDTPALAAGIALLVATAAAASGALLALVAARAPGDAA